MAPTPSETSPRRLLTVAEAAQELNVSVRMIRRLVYDGRLSAHRIGTHVRIGRDDLEAFIGKSRSPQLAK